MRWWRRLLLLAAAGVARSQTLQDILTAQSASLSSLNAWLNSEQLVYEVLNNAQGVTLLAPSNNALNNLYGTSYANQLAEDPNLLTAFLSYHVLNGEYFVSDFANTQAVALPTYLNQKPFSNVTGGQKVESRSQGGAVTFISGNGAQSNIESSDLNYVGGTVHIIDSVLTMPSSLSNALITDGLTATVGAWRRAGIESNLNLASDLTIFVPTNEAFNDIGSTLNSMSVEDLTSVLGYHVIQDKVLYSQLLQPGSAQTVQGGNVNFRAENGELFVNSAKVVAADVLVGNGVVHVVDGVLNPNNTTASPNPAAATPQPAFNGATTTTGGVPFTSAVIPTYTSAAGGPTISVSGPPLADLAAPAKTAAVGAAALFGGAAMWANL